MIKYVWASVDGGAYDWYNEDVLKNAKSEGDITTYKIKTCLTAHIKNLTQLEYNKVSETSPKELMAIGVNLQVFRL